MTASVEERDAAGSLTLSARRERDDATESPVQRRSREELLIPTRGVVEENDFLTPKGTKEEEGDGGEGE